MIEIYVFSVVFILGIIAAIIGSRKSREILLVLGIIFTVLSIIIILIEGVACNTTKYEVVNTLGKYYELTEKVEAIKNSDDSSLNVFKKDLSYDIYSMNQTIRTHRRYKSKWNGFKYSEEIANLKEIELW